MNVAVRADASPEIGAGHVMRCLSLAGGLRRDGARVRLVSRALPRHFHPELAQQGIELSLLPAIASDTGSACSSSRSDQFEAMDAQMTIESLSPDTWDWLVVDHYGLTAGWETAVRTAADRVLVIDDLADRPHACDLLLDQNLYRDMETRYAGLVPETCRVLAGPRHALLRDEFLKLRESAPSRSGSVGRILVSFGGADAGNHTSVAIEALARLDLSGLEVDVVVGALHPSREQIESACEAHGFVCHIETRRMAQLMASADLAIGAGGSTVWERCCLGLPAITFPVAENQRRVVEEAAFAGLLYTPGGAADCLSLAGHLSALCDNPALLRSLSHNGMQAVDGRGVDRVLRAMEGQTISIREATERDADAMLAWRNDASVRGMSKGAAPIGGEEHAAWFARALSDTDRFLLVGERDGEPIGVVRFDVTSGLAEVSIYLVPGLGYRGLGVPLLTAAERWLARTRPDVHALSADVLGYNASSHRLFQSTGYMAHTTHYRKDVGAA